ncbi:hypothetical protein [Salinigranum sp. GCM10025319]|uniref:hypothetical protein n=1 Tax=Salinigranum sp. GCM10025319 TaxID=3252687 RepID=UPI0036222776
MTDDSEVGRLPQFARDIAVLARGPSPGRTAGSDHGVLPPFSGVLDVHADRGRVPTLDLSYLTLGPLVVPGVARPRGETRGSSTTDSDPDGRSSARRDTTNAEGREPTVREVISGQGAAGEGVAPDRSSAVLDDTPRTHLDPGTGRADRRSDALDTTGRERPDTDAPFDAPARTTVDRSGANDSSAGTGSSTPARTQAVRTENGPEATPTPSGRRSTGVDDRTLPIPPLDGVAPPRMLARRTEPTEGGRRASGTDAEGIAPPRLIPERPAAATDTGPSSSGPSDRDGRSGPRRSTPGDATGARPRMIVDRGLREERVGDRVDDSAATNDRNGSSGDGLDTGRHESSGHASDDSDERLAAVVEASTDPESRLVDRLYRALRERQAIERRRRGGR